MNKSSITCFNCNLDYPIICSMDILKKRQYNILQNDFLLKPNSLFFKMLKEGEIVNITYLDSSGILYKVLSIDKLGYSNKLFGFNFVTFDFTYNVKVLVEQEKELNISELISYGLKVLRANKFAFEGTLLPINKWVSEFKNLNKRDDVLRYLFYFTDNELYLNPDENDFLWKSKKSYT